MLKLHEKTIDFNPDLMPIEIQRLIQASLNKNESVIRCALGKDKAELGIINTKLNNFSPFSFRRPFFSCEDLFNVAFIVPTGVGASCGGHSGDANTVYKTIAKVADKVITHPNVVNSADLNEITDNTYYVEGSILSRFLAGQIRLSKKRSNRILAIIQNKYEDKFMHSSVNAVNAAKAVFGANIIDILVVDDFSMKVEFATSGRASGRIEDLTLLRKILQIYKKKCDAIAITSTIDTDPVIRDSYLYGNGSVNPWGGVEALLTHWISYETGLPSAHAPTGCPDDDALDFGVVDPRMASETVSATYFPCVLKGLMHAPSVVSLDHPNAMSVGDLSAIVMPQGCLGIPIYAALYQGIPVIAVEDGVQAGVDNNIIKALPWKDGQYIEASNYMEAVGILTAMKAGISVDSVRRPLKKLMYKKEGKDKKDLI